MVKILLTFIFCCLYSTLYPSIDSSFVLKILIPENLKTTNIYLLYQQEGEKYIDSARIYDNQIEFRGKVSAVLPATIFIDHQHLGIDQILTKKSNDFIFFQIKLHAGQIKFQLDQELKNLIALNSPLNKDFLIFQKQLQPLREKRINLEHVLMNNSDDSIRANAQLQIMELKDMETKMMFDFIENNSDSEFSLDLLRILHIQEENATRMNQKWNYPSSITLFESLDEQIRKSKDGLNLFAIMYQNNRLHIGQPAPDFTLKDGFGNKHQLSDYKGKYILIDFWASWCGPCKEEFPALRKLNNHFKDKNFMMIGVSLDDKSLEKNWKQTIKTEKLDWLQLSDLKHWDSDIVKLYSVYSIPANILIDSEGRIIARNKTILEIEKILEQR